MKAFPGFNSWVYLCRVKRVKTIPPVGGNFKSESAKINGEAENPIKSRRKIKSKKNEKVISA